MEFQKLIVLEPYLADAFQKFYDQMLSHETLKVFFEDKVQIKTLVERQKANFIESLQDDVNAFKQRFIHLGILHYKLKIPHVDFIRGSQILLESLIETSVKEISDPLLVKMVHQYSRISNQWLSYGYLSEQIQHDELDVAHMITHMQESKLPDLDSLVLEQMQWLEKILLAIKAENKSLAPELDAQKCTFHQNFHNLVSNDLLKQFDFLDKDHLNDMHSRLHLDARNIFYFLERNEYTEVLPLYNSLLNVYKMTLMFISSMTAKTSIEQLQKNLSLKEKNEQQLRDLVEERTAQLQEVSERYEIAIRSNDLGMWDLEVASNRVSHNDTWYQVMGWSKGKVENTFDAWKRLIHQDDLEKVLDKFNVVMSSKARQYDVEYRVRTEDGQIRWLHDFGKPYYDINGFLVRVTGFVQDITDKKLAEEEVRFQKDFLHNLMDNAPVPIFYKDIEGRYIGCNKKFLEINGFESEEEIIGKNVFDVAAKKEQAQIWHQKDIEVFSLQENPQIYEYFIKNRKSGEEHNVVFYKSAFMDSQGKVGGLIGTILDITERKILEIDQNQALLNLEIANREFEYLLDNMTDVYYRTDSEGYITRVSPACESFIGYKPEELIGTKMTDYYAHSEERENIASAIINGRGQAVTVETNLRHRNGEEVWVSSNSYVLLDQEGNIKGIEGLSRNMTDYKRYEKKLHQLNNELEKRVEEELKRRLKGEAVFQKISDHTFDGILMIDENGKTISWSNACERIFGYSNSEMIGESFHLKVLPEGMKEEYKKGFERFSKTGDGPVVGKLLEFAAIHKEGHSVPVEITVSSLQMDGKWHAIGIVRDLTEKKKLEREKEQQQRLLKSIYDTVNIGICLVDQEGKFVEFNKKFCDVFAYEREELIGSHYEVILGDQAKERAKVIFDDFADSSVLELHEWHVRARSGQDKIVYTTWNDLRDDQGNIYKLFAIEDVTRQKELEKTHQDQEQLLIQQSKLAEMGNMIAAIAHQWKQPLNSIALLGNLIEDELYDHIGESSKAIKHVESISEHIDFLSHTIDDFRNFFKPSKIKKSFNVKKSVEQICNMLSSQFYKYNIDLQIKGGSDITAFGLDNEFKQVIMNITTNAADAIMERDVSDGRIEVNVGQREGMAYISISDNGGGIPEELLPDKLFDPYITTKGEKGTGIGLSMSRNIIERHQGGKLWVENARKGACFHIMLPSTPLDENGELYPIRILYVEDDEMIRASVQSLLQNRYAKIFVASNGAEGVECFEKNHEQIDLIVTDINMPVMNGNTMSRKIREIDQEVPILVITSLREDVEPGVFFTAVLEKPINKNKLYQAIDNLMNISG